MKRSAVEIFQKSGTAYLTDWSEAKTMEPERLEAAGWACAMETWIREKTGLQTPKFPDAQTAAAIIEQSIPDLVEKFGGEHKLRDMCRLIIDCNDKVSPTVALKLAYKILSDEEVDI